MASALAASTAAFFLHDRQGHPWHLPLFGAMPDWGAVLICVGLPGILLAILSLRIREPKRPTSQKSVTTQGSGAEFLLFLRTRARLNGVYTLAMALAVSVNYSLTAWNAVILSRVFGWSPAMIGKIFSSMGLACGVFGCLLAGLVSHMLVKRNMIPSMLHLAQISSGIMCLCGLAMPFVANGWQYFAIALTGAIIAPLLFTLGPTLLQFMTPPALSGRMTSFFMLVVIGLGAGGGPSLVGFLSSSVFTSARLNTALGSVVAGASLLAVVGFTISYRSFTTHLAGTNAVPSRTSPVRS
ncbi:MFS transporter [Gluconacetobacter liquefaciens]|uniref:MFS transporter n=1 Tax=Gluconacetobacter liquefaciens TaxID=89584 RepID=A0A7W4PBB4_GLULI|nr:MFS transporter [Gluconacetobacter liquefaciens]MBB2188007.1 MFS transporter [Gluconacetobacter liquefaciens]